MTLASVSAWLPTQPMAHPTFERIFEEHVRYVGRTLRYLGVAERELDDACQEVFIVVHRRLADLQPDGARPWIRQICVHVAQNARRSARRRRESGDEPPEVLAAPTQQTDAERNQMRARLLQVLEALEEEQRIVFVLYEIEGLKMNEVAAAAECPIQTAYSRLHAARARVQRAFASEEEAQ
jgi:RNA polymerase sigma-70 factor (ECF subfamily)